MELGYFDVKEPDLFLNNIVYNNFRPLQAQGINFETNCTIVKPSVVLQEKKEKATDRVTEKLCLLEVGLVITTDVFFLSLTILCKMEILRFKGQEFESIDDIEDHELVDLTKFAANAFRDLANREVVEFLKKTPTRANDDTIFWPADVAIA